MLFGLFPYLVSIHCFFIRDTGDGPVLKDTITLNRGMTCPLNNVKQPMQTLVNKQHQTELSIELMSCMKKKKKKTAHISEMEYTIIGTTCTLVVTKY